MDPLIVGCACQVCRQCLDSVSIVSGQFLEVSGQCLESVLIMSGWCLVGARQVSKSKGLIRFCYFLEKTKGPTLD